MKKISCLISLLLCVVIGGVYANWAYSASEDIQDQFVELSLGLAGSSQTGADGVYEIDTNASFKIYQKEGSNHVAEMRVESTDDQTPYLTVKFTPTASASVDIKENGVPTEIAFTTSSPFLYKIDADGNYDATNGTDTKVLKFQNEADGEFHPNVTWLEGTTEGSSLKYFYVTWEGEELLDLVNLSDEVAFVLDVRKEYVAFQDALLHAGSIIVKVTDGNNIL